MLTAEDAWIDESAVASEWTGEWSNGIEYDSDGHAPLFGDNVFTANTPSGGNRVTMTVTATFCDVPGMEETPPEGAQGAVWLGTNGCFQVWTRLRQGYGGQAESGWVDVEADGVTPATGVEYTFRFTFDYKTKTYSVAVQYGAEWKSLAATGGGTGTTQPATFPLATSGTAISSVRFTGDGIFTSLFGDWMKNTYGFALRLF